MLRLHPQVLQVIFAIAVCTECVNINIHKASAISICHSDSGQKDNCFRSDFILLQYVPIFSFPFYGIQGVTPGINCKIKFCNNTPYSSIDHWKG